MCETPLLHLSQLLEQDFQPYCLEIPEGSGAYEGPDDTVAPLPPSPLQNRLNLPPSLTCRRSRLSNCAAPSTTAFSFAMSSRVSSSAFAPPPASHSFSLPVQLYSHFCSHSCDWLVSHGLSPVTFTQWCFGCSSGKRVSMFVLFCYYPD